MGALDSGDLIGIVAIAAAVLGIVNLIIGASVWRFVRRVRRAQDALVGDRRTDLVEFAIGMQTRIERVEELAVETERLAEQTAATAGRGLRRRAIVRYDALPDAGGHQSVSLALLDEEGSGVVVTALQDDGHARLFVKDVARRRAVSIGLSDEEQLAVTRAMRA